MAMAAFNRISSSLMADLHEPISFLRACSPGKEGAE